MSGSWRIGATASRWESTGLCDVLNACNGSISIPKSASTPSTVASPGIFGKDANGHCLWYVKIFALVFNLQKNFYDALDQFYRKHEEYARLPHKYLEAVILKDTLPIHLINAYRSTFATNEVLPDVGFQFMRPEEYGISRRATQVAEVAGYIAFPHACGDAALVAAYAM